MIGSDGKVLDTAQIINGIAVLLSFFAGYKYAIKKRVGDETQNEAPEKAPAVFADIARGYKMVLVVRNDLKMGKGKIASQCGHGAVAAYQKSLRRNPHFVRQWESTGCAKIALKVDSKQELMIIHNSAKANGLISCPIQDAGRTQIEPNTLTVVAIGPAPIEDIDKITGYLKLL